MTTQDKLTKAKIQLILNHPFFATLLYSMKMIEDKDVPTACTNGKEIRYNAAFVDGLTVDETIGLICHEILHVANFHHTRREGRDAENWNSATDYAINQMLVDSGLTLPKGGLIDKQYKDLSAEQIYTKLPAPKPKEQPGNEPGKQPENNPQGEPDQQPTPDPGKCGAVKDSPAQTEGEKQEQEAKIKQTVAQAIQQAKRAGKLPGHLQRMAEEILEPKVNWKETLARFITDTARNDYSFKKPNPRFIQSGFYLPSLYNEEPGNIVFIVDTSGSIDEDLFKQFAGEIQDVCSEMKATLTVIYVDTEVNGVQEIEPDEKVKLIAMGGGGTRFSPGFDYIDEQGLSPKAIVYMTDGYCSEYPETTPDTPTLWAVYNNKHFRPPFGEVISID